MYNYCCVKGCGYYKDPTPPYVKNLLMLDKTDARIKQQTYFSFPDDEALFYGWFSALGISVPEQEGIICADHFEDESVLIHENGQKELLRGAVPTKIENLLAVAWGDNNLFPKHTCVPNDEFHLRITKVLLKMVAIPDRPYITVQDVKWIRRQIDSNYYCLLVDERKARMQGTPEIKEYFTNVTRYYNSRQAEIAPLPHPEPSDNNVVDLPRIRQNNTENREVGANTNGERTPGLNQQSVATRGDATATAVNTQAATAERVHDEDIIVISDDETRSLRENSSNIVATAIKEEIIENCDDGFATAGPGENAANCVKFKYLLTSFWQELQNILSNEATRAPRFKQIIEKYCPMADQGETAASSADGQGGNTTSSIDGATRVGQRKNAASSVDGTARVGQVENAVRGQGENAASSVDGTARVGQGENTARGQGENAASSVDGTARVGQGENAARGQGENAAISVDGTARVGQGENAARGQGENAASSVDGTARVGQGENAARCQGKNAASSVAGTARIGQGENAARGQGENAASSVDGTARIGQGENAARGQGENAASSVDGTARVGQGENAARGQGENAASSVDDTARVGQGENTARGQGENTASSADGTARVGQGENASSSVDGTARVGQVENAARGQGENAASSADGTARVGQGENAASSVDGTARVGQGENTASSVDGTARVGQGENAASSADGTARVSQGENAARGQGENAASSADGTARVGQGENASSSVDGTARVGQVENAARGQGENTASSADGTARVGQGENAARGQGENTASSADGTARVGQGENAARGQGENTASSADGTARVGQGENAARGQGENTASSADGTARVGQGENAARGQGENAASSADGTARVAQGENTAISMDVTARVGQIEKTASSVDDPITAAKNTLHFETKLQFNQNEDVLEKGISITLAAKRTGNDVHEADHDTSSAGKRRRVENVEKKTKAAERQKTAKTEDKTTTEHKPDSAEKIKEPSTTADFARDEKCRMKWNKELDRFIMRTYYEETRLGNKIHGDYRKRLHKRFTKEYPKLNMKEVMLKKRRKKLQKGKKFSIEEILDIIKEASELLKENEKTKCSS
ncbi:unnamed protein product [Chrysodeixis includens]|uniref:THAP-type domain-containing protein n=1 Tax=Chrysodeixis includens TaxID=689277 RepID=A0A9N8L148_CHRIL|nr:unnamed protein product [Chrysodeixis includens]